MGFGVGTDQLAATIDGDRPLELNFPGRGRLCFVGGGIPVIVSGEVVGAVGVAGGHYTQDGQVAEAAAAAFGAVAAERP
jgi:glc operon protein GlcG